MKTTNKERPILFKGEMVRAILEGRKTQTRRIMKLQPSIQPTVHFGQEAKLRAGESFKGGALATWPGESEFDYCDCHCPYGGPSDRLWVKETWKPDPAWGQSLTKTKYMTPGDNTLYRATLDPSHVKFSSGKWRPSIFMPRWAYRITLEITNVRVERLQEIVDTDAKAEGVTQQRYLDNPFRTGALNARFSGEVETATVAFRNLWQSINGSESWDANPFVWVIEFKQVAK